MYTKYAATLFVVMTVVFAPFAAADNLGQQVKDTIDENNPGIDPFATTENAKCTVNIGTCEDGGKCDINVGTCGEGGECTINTSKCGDIEDP